MDLNKHAFWLIKQVEEHGDFIQLDDGFWYYSSSSGGGMSAYNMRIIADELDRRNAAYQKQLDDYFAADIAGFKLKQKEQHASSNQDRGDTASQQAE